MIGPGEILSARILIVDDSAVNVRLLEQMLRSAGYSAVTSTTDPRDVCDLYRAERHDLIVLDLLMPVMDGFAVLRALRDVETEGYLPVLVLTAQPGHKLRALQAGAKDFLSKPFDQVEILTRIHNMLEVRLLLRESRNYGRLLEQFDGLTGLPNRTRFRDLLAAARSQTTARGGAVFVMVVSLDRFANTQDALGRATGDALLRVAGDRLNACLGPTDSLARLEGEVFGLLVTTSRDEPRDAATVAARVREALREPLQAEGLELNVTASVGIAVWPADAADADTLIAYAEAALHDAKNAGGDACRFYAVDMNARAVAALELEHALRGALERGEFALHYQPKMNIETSEWSGAEALLRWERPGVGLVMPGTFITMLEETGLIVPVGTWVIRSACRQINEWAQAGIGTIRVAVNVSGRQFLRDGFVADVRDAIQDNAIAPGLLDIEITESSLMSRTVQTDDILRDLKALGVSISVDDFGTGYSNLAYLRRFPIDALKIDISFIRDVGTSADGAALAAAIINLARSLKLKVIAEGVETEMQLDFLRQHACDEIQGYYCSHPLPAGEMMRARQARRATPVAPMLTLFS